MRNLALPPRVRVVSSGEGPDAERLARWFDAAGCSLEAHATVNDALVSLDREPARLIVVLEGEAGDLPAACRRIRDLDSAPLLVVARSQEPVRLAALEAGADDVVSLTASEREVLTRAAALLRRAVGVTPRTSTLGGLTFEQTRHTVRLGQEEVALTAYEFSLLRVLVSHAGQPVRREELLTVAKGSLDASFERSIDVHICRLRRKLGALGPMRVKTVRGVGYVFERRDPA